jgi:hypothetical protein
MPVEPPRAPLLPMPLQSSLTSFTLSSMNRPLFNAHFAWFNTHIFRTLD